MSRYRVLDCQWVDGLDSEKKAAIQAHNANPANALDTSGYVYLVQRGVPPAVAIAWEPALCLSWF